MLGSLKKCKLKGSRTFRHWPLIIIEEYLLKQCVVIIIIIIIIIIISSSSSSSSSGSGGSSSSSSSSSSSNSSRNKGARIIQTLQWLGKWMDSGGTEVRFVWGARKLPFHSVQTRSEVRPLFYLLDSQALFSGTKGLVLESNHPFPSNIQACRKIHELSMCLFGMGMK